MNKDSDDNFVDEFTYEQGLAVALVAGLIFFMFIYFGDESKARGVLVSSGAILATIKIFWPLRRRVWFWITMGCITIAHLIAIISVPWSNEAFSGFALAPIIVLDVVAIFLVVRLLARIIGRRDRNDQSSHDDHSHHGESE